ncbi:exodeoxyribonuclease V subunit beta [Vreelandella utahensis]|uniref:exodeoxyribonuclease V subunit beta n=1 Tax=Vreelandella halophila TaxID=86177 RepID=UPI000984DD69|nr:exodeoxyribonuclease V subunit beta [Halomonas utahensis]
MQELDVTHLPLEGIHLIEASAGTGKTYNITRLYLRLLLEQELEVQQLLVMTFTRAATAELKGRLAGEIQRAHDHWETLEEPFYKALRERFPDTTRVRARLRNAALHMDEAAIYTIHSFCRRALTQEAFTSGISFDAAMEVDSSALVREALEDWYRQEAQGAYFQQLYAYQPTPEAFAKVWEGTIKGTETLPEPEVPDLEGAWQAFCNQWPEEREAFATHNVESRRKPETRAAWEAVQEELERLSSRPWDGSIPDVFQGKFLKEAFSSEKKKQTMPALYELASAMAGLQRAREAWWAWRGVTFAREHLAASKDRLDQLDFSDLIRRLSEQLASAERGPALAQSLGEQFPVALVDEFQDTDPDQYAILQRIYGGAREQGRMLCMIGDPKQAIYGFRGGDVFAYLTARNDADHQWVMGANYRSAPEVIRGYNRLFHGEPVPGDPREAIPDDRIFGYGIQYPPVSAGRPERQPVSGPAGRAAFQWGLLPVGDDMEGLSSKGTGYTKEGRKPLAQWTAREILRLLAGADVDGEAVAPEDIAVLVRDRIEAALMQDALTARGLDSVYLSARDNVLQSAESLELLRALRGILNLEDDRQLMAALATMLFGYGTRELFELRNSERDWARLLDDVTALRERWHRKGFMSMALQLLQWRARPEPQRHERSLTNLMHLMELLQEASQQHRQPEALLHWFEQARTDSTVQNTELRLESDGHLVRVVTMHGAKGLEYPIVFLPFVSYGRQGGSGRNMLVRYHDPRDHSAHLALNPSDEQLNLAAEEDAAESIRLLYVAATRGERRVYVLAAAFDQLASSPLARCLRVSSFEALEADVQQQHDEGACGVLTITSTDEPVSSAPQPTSNEGLTAAEFGGRIERDWWLSSFSALTRNARHGGTSARDRDQAELEEVRPHAEADNVRFSLQKGAEAGNLLHDVLEWLDFSDPDLDGVLDQAERRYPGLLTPGESTREPIKAWLRDLLAVELPSGATLSALPSEKTLRESEFYFPMNADQHPPLGRILARHRGSGAGVSLPPPASLKGMLQGFIDLVYEWQGRYYIVDYKSNHLGNGFGSYNPEALTANMRESFYDLQYLLYMLALHRFLRIRIPDYDPQQHLGGVHYLYLRGMAPGRDTGIHAREPDLAALFALDALFEGREVTV